MSKAQDIQENEQLAHKTIEQLPKEVSALIGFHALTELAHTMAPEKFAEFIQNATQEAQQTFTDFQQSAQI